MGPEFALLMFLMSLCCAGGLIAVPWLHLAPSMERQLSTRLACLQSVCLTVSVALLLWAFYQTDLSVQIVARYSHASMPWMYRLCALWGGHEGALLLWVWILSAYAYVVAYRRDPVLDSLRPKVLSLLALIYTALSGFVLLTSNPFARFLPTSPEFGQGLNPLLQDMGMVMHPPMLYLGYVGLSVVFAFTLIALWQRQIHAAFARAVKPYAFFAWAALTIGIILGSWWAYRELGWGGWWFWDPVENASFMPWLAALGLLHMLMVLERTSVWVIWTVLLAVLGFVLSLMGTFLVRSGVLVSVHAFAEDPHRGLVLLVYLALAMLGTFWVLMRCAPTIQRAGAAVSARSGWMAAGSVLAMVALLTVLLGTLYPLVAQAFFEQKVSVGAPYFNQILTPVFLFAAFLSGLAVQAPRFAPLKVRQMCSTLAWVVGIEGVLVLSCVLNNVTLTPFWVLGSTVAVWLAYTSLMSGVSGRASGAMSIAHIGFAIVIFAATTVSQFETMGQWSLKPGERVRQGDWQVSLHQVSAHQGPNYKARQAHLQMKHLHTGQVLTFKPQQRLYTDSGMALAKVAIHVQWWQDIYVALGQRLGPQAWAVRIMIKPGVRWVWYGGVLMALGMLWAMVRRRGVV